MANPVIEDIRTWEPRTLHLEELWEIDVRHADGRLRHLYLRKARFRDEVAAFLFLTKEVLPYG